MTTERNSSLIMFVLLSLLIFIYTLGAGIYGVYGAEPSPTAEFLYNAAFFCGLIWWLQADRGRSAVKAVYCLGLLGGVGWWIIIPYHLIKTRGTKGLLPLLALIGSFILAQILTIILYVARFGLNPALSSD